MNEILNSAEQLQLQGVENSGVDCSESINDELSDIDNPGLVDAISDAANQGIDARVVIQHSIGEEGYLDPEDVYVFSADFVQYCQVGEPSVIFVVSDGSPRSFDVLTSGTADAPYASGPEEGQLIDAVEADLKNDGSSYQSDAANAIDTVLDDIAEHEEAFVNTKQVETLVGQPVPGGDTGSGNTIVPLVYGGGALSVAALFAAGGTLIKRSKNYNKLHRSIKSRITESNTAAIFAGTSADEMLGILNDDDAEKLRELVGRLESEQAGAKAVVDKFIQQESDARTRLSRPREISALYDAGASKAVEDLMGLSTEVRDETSRVSGLAADVPKKRAKLEIGFQQLKEELRSLHAQGYDVRSFQVGIGHLEAEKESVAALIDGMYIVKTHRIMTEFMDHTEMLLGEASGIHSLWESLAVREIEVFRLSELDSSTLAEVEQVTRSTMTELHPDYARESEILLKKAQALVNEISMASAFVSSTQGTKSIDLMYNRRSTIDTFDSQHKNFGLVVSGIADLRHEWIETRDVNLPQKLAETQKLISRFDRLVESSNGDIEPATARAIEDIRGAAGDTKGEFESADRPQVMELLTNTRRDVAETEKLTRKARIEIAEMNGLRQEILSAPGRLEGLLRNAQSFVRYNRRDVGASIREELESVTISFGAKETREGMKSLVKEIEATESHVHNLYDRAKRQHEAAESVREIRRQQEIRQEQIRLNRIADAAAAKARSRAVSRSSGPSRGSFKRGGGHKGGGF